MATLRWLGRAAARAEVRTLTVGGTVEAGDLFVTTINGKSVSVAAPSTSTSATASAIQAAIDALDGTDYPEFAEVTATVVGSAVYLTHGTPGVPFSVTATTTESNGGTADDQTYVAAVATAATGPNHWNDANNWDGGTVPANGDTVYVENTSTSILYGLDASAVTLAALYVKANFTGSIGLPSLNSSGAAPYPEYRDQYLKVGATVQVLGEGEGQLSGRVKIDNGSVATTLTVLNTGTSPDQDVPPLLWKGTSSSNVVHVMRGSVGAAWAGGEAANIATLNVGYIDNPSSDADVYCGNVTFATAVSQNGGKLRLGTGVTTLTLQNGECLVDGAGAYTTVNCWASNLTYTGTGTVTTMNLSNGAGVDYAPSRAARTVTTCNVYGPGVTINDPNTTVTFTNPVNLYGAGMEDVTWRRGRNIKVTAVVI